MQGKRYRAKQTFGVEFNGEQITVHQGEVLNSANEKAAALLKQLGTKGREEHFEDFDGFGPWDVEQATAAPGEKRGSK